MLDFSVGSELGLAVYAVLAVGRSLLPALGAGLHRIEGLAAGLAIFRVRRIFGTAMWTFHNYGYFRGDDTSRGAQFINFWKNNQKRGLLHVKKATGSELETTSVTCGFASILPPIGS